MTQWEYCRTTVPQEELDAALVQGGEQGWELVAMQMGAIAPKVATIMQGGGAKPAWMLVFKRPVVPQPTQQPATESNNGTSAALLFSR